MSHALRTNCFCPDCINGRAAAMQREGIVSLAAPQDQDPTFEYRRKIANFCETACRLFNDIDNLPADADLATTRALLDTAGKKLRAAVMAATEP